MQVNSSSSRQMSGVQETQDKWVFIIHVFTYLQFYFSVMKSISDLYTATKAAVQT
jgi:hypothetical protein